MKLKEAPVALSPDVASWLQTGRAVVGPTVRRLRSVLGSSLRHKRLRWAAPGVAVRIPSTDGLHLLGYLYRPQSIAEPTPGIIILHSSDPRGQRHGFYLVLAEAMRRRGFTVLTFNFRGYPGSDKPQDLHEFTMEKLVQDVYAAFDLMLQTGYVSPERVALYGHSYGAGIVLPALMQKSRLWKAIVHGPPDWNEERIYGPQATQRALFRVRFWRYMTIDGPLPESTFLHLAADLDALRQIQSLPTAHAPVLLLHGANEPAEARAFVKEVYGRISPPCNYYVIPGADHFCNTADFGNLIIYDQMVTDNLVEVLCTWLQGG